MAHTILQLNYAYTHVITNLECDKNSINLITKWHEMGSPQHVLPVPNSTIVRNRYLGFNPSGRGLSWDVLLYQMVQWHRMDTWDLNPLVGTVRSPWDVPPVPNSTMVMGWTLGIKPLLLVQWWDVPPVPNGTMRWTLGIEPLWLVQWNYPKMSHQYQTVQWYGMDTWD